MIDVKNLTITNVSQKNWGKTGIDITFEINHSDEVYHLSNINTDCSYCDGNKVACDGLRKYKKDLFYRLIEFPSIRLEWLYIPHAVKA